MEVGLLVVRVVVGVLVAAHGAQKLFGWFGGHGLDGTAGFLESMGYRPGRPMALAAGLGELGGGALLAAGLLTPLGVAAVIGAALAILALRAWTRSSSGRTQPVSGTA